MVHREAPVICNKGSSVRKSRAQWKDFCISVFDLNWSKLTKLGHMWFDENLDLGYCNFDLVYQNPNLTSVINFDPFI